MSDPKQSSCADNGYGPFFLLSGSSCGRKADKVSETRHYQIDDNEPESHHNRRSFVDIANKGNDKNYPHDCKKETRNIRSRHLYGIERSAETDKDTY